MRERGVAVDRMHCTAALSACTLPASWPFAVEILGMVQAAQIQADVILYSSAISVLSRARWQLAAELFWNLGAMRIPSDITAVTAALHAYSTGTRWETCAWLLSHTRNWDSVACTTAISSCEKARRWEVALGFFATAVAQGIRRDAAMYNATIACSSQGGLGWIGVLRLVHEMARESIQKSTTTCNSVLTALERLGCWEQALAFFREMPGFSLVPELISYNATMTSFEKESRWEEVLSLLVEAKSRRMGDGISYNCCIAACQKASNWLHTLALLEEMRGSLARPDSIAYNSAILASSGMSRWETHASPNVRSSRHEKERRFPLDMTSKPIDKAASGQAPSPTLSRSDLAPVRSRSQTSPSDSSKGPAGSGLLLALLGAAAFASRRPGPATFAGHSRGHVAASNLLVAQPGDAVDIESIVGMGQVPRRPHVRICDRTLKEWSRGRRINSAAKQRFLIRREPSGRITVWRRQWGQRNLKSKKTPAHLKRLKQMVRIHRCQYKRVAKLLRIHFVPPKPCDFIMRKFCEKRLKDHLGMHDNVGVSMWTGTKG
ncbi:unnamed protein product [Symbiodinium microadriaticum]|nr:unnamed protein product [Symbiodinium microadriaticum]